MIGRRGRAGFAWIALVGAATQTGCSGDTVVLGDGRSAASDTAGQVPTFSRVSVMASISAAGTVDDDPSLTSDLLNIYFDSKRDGGLGEEDIWRASRTAPDVEWGPAEPVVELNTTARETGIALSGNGLTVWFSSNREGTLGGLDVFVSTRGSLRDAWGPVVRVDEVSSSEDDLVSAADEAGTTLFLARRASADSDYDIYVARRTSSTEPWSAPEPVDGLDTSKEESDAFPIERDAAMLFTRSKDLFLASRSGSSDSFDVVGPLSSLNSSDDDRDPWASDDASYVVFSSNRSGEYLLYEAWR